MFEIKCNAAIGHYRNTPLNSRDSGVVHAHGTTPES